MKQMHIQKDYFAASPLAHEWIGRINEYIKTELKPLEEANDIGWDGAWDKSMLQGIWDRCVELGFFNLMMPKAQGGEGLSVVDLCAIKHAVSRSGAVLCNHVLGELSGPPRVGHLFSHSSQHIIDTYLWPICRAEKTVCFAITETDAGSDAAALKAEAVKVDGGYRLSGHKHYISGAPYADSAIIIAKTRDGDQNTGVAAFFVDLLQDGIKIDADYVATHGQYSHADIIMDNAYVPAENLIGALGEGFKLGISRITFNRLTHCPTMLGYARKGYERSVKYAMERKQFGGPIAQFQAIQHMLADMATELFAAESMMYAAAAQLDAGLDIRKEACMAKLHCAEVGYKVADLAVQVHGGVALIKGHPVEWLYRFMRMWRIVNGTSEIQRNTIAKEILTPRPPKNK